MKPQSQLLSIIGYLLFAKPYIFVKKFLDVYIFRIIGSHRIFANPSVCAALSATNVIFKIVLAVKTVQNAVAHARHGYCSYRPR